MGDTEAEKDRERENFARQNSRSRLNGTEQKYFYIKIITDC